MFKYSLLLRYLKFPPSALWVGFAKGSSIKTITHPAIHPTIHTPIKTPTTHTFKQPPIKISNLSSIKTTNHQNTQPSIN